MDTLSAKAMNIHMGHTVLSEALSAVYDAGYNSDYDDENPWPKGTEENEIWQVAYDYSVFVNPQNDSDDMIVMDGIEIDPDQYDHDRLTELKNEHRVV